MKNRSSDNKPQQNVQARRNAEVVGRDKVTTTNISIWIPISLIVMLAFGGIAWAMNAGWIKDSGNPQHSPFQPGSSTPQATYKPSK